MNILKRPMLWATVVCSVTSAVSIFSASYAVIFVIVSVALLAVISFKKSKYIVVIFAILCFFVSLLIQQSKIEKLKSNNHVQISGEFVVLEEPTFYEDFNTLILKSINCQELPKNVKLFCFDYELTQLKMGDVVTAQFDLKAVEQSSKYFYSNYGDGVFATASIKSINVKGYHSLYRNIFNARNKVKNIISNKFNGDESGLLLAVTTGDKTLFSKEFLSNVKTTGISHIIVVSGMHLSIILTAVFLLLDKLFYNRFLKALFSVIVVLLIAVVCGFTMSVLRAGAMFFIAALAPLFNRESDSLNSLLFAVVLVLITAPYAILNISFQLSVLSTLAIIWVVPVYYSAVITKFNINSKILKSILNVILCSIFAMIFTLPVTIKTFGFVSIVSPLTNLFVTIPTTVTLIINILAVMLSIVPVINALSNLLFVIAGFGSKTIIYIVNYIAKLPITVAVLPKYATWWSVLIIGLVVGYMYIYKFMKKRSEINANRI